MCEMKSVTEGTIYIDMNEDLPEDEHNYIFIGKVGQFTPVKEGTGGGILYRVKDGSYYAISGTKGYRFKESDMVKDLDEVDQSYYQTLCDKAVDTVEKFGSYEWFISDEFHYEEDWSNVMNEPTGDPDEVPFDED
jgi:hypothetical protein